MMRHEFMTTWKGMSDEYSASPRGGIESGWGDSAKRGIGHHGAARTGSHLTPPYGECIPQVSI